VDVFRTPGGTAVVAASAVGIQVAHVAVVVAEPNVSVRDRVLVDVEALWGAAGEDACGAVAQAPLRQ
jgi:hypothetical protein